MPRHYDPHVPGAVYHVTLRGAYRSELYFAADDRGVLIEILSEVIERFAGKLHSYSNGHDTLQLLIQVGEESVGRMMLRVARRYAHALQESLPEVHQVVNRLFEIRVRRTALPEVYTAAALNGRVRAPHPAPA